MGQILNSSQILLEYTKWILLDFETDWISEKIRPAIISISEVPFISYL